MKLQPAWPLMQVCSRGVALKSPWLHRKSPACPSWLVHAVYAPYQTKCQINHTRGCHSRAGAGRTMRQLDSRSAPGRTSRGKACQQGIRRVSGKQTLVHIIKKKIMDANALNSEARLHCSVSWTNVAVHMRTCSRAASVHAPHAHWRLLRPCSCF